MYYYHKKTTTNYALSMIIVDKYQLTEKELARASRILRYTDPKYTRGNQITVEKSSARFP